MDIASVVGIIIGTLASIQFGMGGFQNLMMFWEPNSVGLMIIGIIGSILIGCPISDVLKLPKICMHVFFDKGSSLKELIAEIVSLAEKARRDGILALESALENVKDPFLKKGIQLAVDGTDPELIRVIMSEEMDAIKSRHKDGRGMIATMNKYCPAWGMIGTVFGMILLLANLSDPDKIGPAMSLALLTTLYGAIASNFVLGPMADKLNARNTNEMLTKTVILNGVMSIQQGDNPRIVMQKLEVYLSPNQREAKKN